MSRKKVIFLGSKPIGFECFAHLLQMQESLGFDVIGLLTNTRKEFSGQHDLAALAKNYDVPVIETLDEIPQCDTLYSVQYHKILKPAQISKAAELAVNLHMAPLPEYRGSNQFSYAIIDGKKEFGTTLHIMDARIDHGDILFQKRFAIPDNCWVNDLYLLTFDASITLFKETLPDIISGNYTPTPQASLIEKYGTSLHYRDEIANLKCIDPTWDKEKIDLYIRATSMPGFEPPYSIINGEKVYYSTNQE